MGKQTMAVVAITIITASAVSAPLSTEARGVSDIRSSLTYRHHPLAETRTYAGNDDSKRGISNVKLVLPHEISLEINRPSQVTPPSLGSVPTNNAEKEAPVNDAENNEQEFEVATDTNTSEKNISSDVSSDDFMSELANEIHRLTNIERERAGVPKLEYDHALAEIAEQHSEDMAQNDYFSHVAEDGCNLACRLAEGGYDASAWGENIAWRSSSQLPEAKELAAHFVRGWMNSDGHRRNMLSSNFTHEGIGLARIGNKVYATANFADPR